MSERRRIDRIIEGDEYSKRADQGVGYSRAYATERGYQIIIGSEADFITDKELARARARRRKGPAR